MSAEKASLAKPAILLIENDPLSVQLYERELAAEFTVLVCRTENALRAALNERSGSDRRQAAVMIVEPANGNEWIWDFLAAWRQAPTIQKVPVIFCTVLDEKKRGLDAGACFYLVKPVYAHTLRGYVSKALLTSPQRNDWPSRAHSLIP